MGTAGLLIVRFHGRYFVYENSHDSYPKGLGREIVNQIPADSSQYEEWLESQRAIYAQMTADLESKVLTVTEETLREYGSDKEFVSWQMIDDRLICLPSALCAMWPDSPAEWIYTMDLDLETFSVDMWVHFTLKNIPRERWIEGFSESDDTDRMEFCFGICPEATDERPEIEYFVNDISRDKKLLTYQRYDCNIVVAKSKIDPLSKAAPRQIIAVVLFEEFASHYSILLKHYLPRWSHNDFAFRELAFAALSFATGQFHFERPEFLHGEASNGYLIVPSDDTSSNNPKLLPIFGSGCHNPGEEAGSAPLNSIYWFENVLVSLVPDVVLEGNTEAAIAKVVEFGLEDGRKIFYAVVFSLVNVIMLEVAVENGITAVKRTKITELTNSVETYEFGVKSLETYCEESPGFVALMLFFNVAAIRHVTDFSGQGCFPTEIYAKILANADCFTYNACAMVSSEMHALCQEKIMFNHDYMITKFSGELYSMSKDWQFTFKDRNTGDILELRLNLFRRWNVPAWCPVIGAARPSIMDEVYVRFDVGSTQIPPKPKRTELSRGFLNSRRQFDSKYNIPRNAIVSEVEEFWGCYLAKIFAKGAWRSRNVHLGQYLCTLIPHYRELYVSFGNSDLELLVCVRRPVDGDTPQKRAETLAYVTARHSSKANEEEPVIVAFGMNVGLYVWEANTTGGGHSLRLQVHFEDYGREKSRIEFETKALLPLMKTWEEEVERESD